MKPFLLLSKQSTALIAHCLQSSESKPPAMLPKLQVNRMLAREHRANPALDPSYRNTVFTQVWQHHALCGYLPAQHHLSPLHLIPFPLCSSPAVRRPQLFQAQSAPGLQVSLQHHSFGVSPPWSKVQGMPCASCFLGGGMYMRLLLPHRWPTNYTQWWECDFVTEGIIDNGESTPLLLCSSPQGFLILEFSSVGCLLRWGVHAVPASLWEAAMLCTPVVVPASLVPHQYCILGTSICLCCVRH